MTATAIRTGDIFRWRYKSEKLNNDHLSYWAKSCIAVAVADGFLRDTYWSSPTDGSMWTYEEAADRLNLTPIANFADLEKISEGEAEYYAEADIVNLNHGNSSRGNCYRRKGTERSRTVMLDKLDYEIKKAKSEIRSAQRDVERLTETKAALTNGGELKGVWI